MEDWFNKNKGNCISLACLFAILILHLTILSFFFVAILKKKKSELYETQYKLRIAKYKIVIQWLKVWIAEMNEWQKKKNYDRINTTQNSEKKRSKFQDINTELRDVT